MNDTIEKIIRFDLCPLQNNNQGNDYYEPLFRQLGKVEEKFDASYRIHFEAPEFSSKVKYYKRLIDNALTKYLNGVFSDESKKDIVLYKRKKLRDFVSSNLIDIKDIITKKNLDLDVIFSVRDYSQALLQNECTYIFHYLILSLIRCYMEFQQHFISMIESDKQLTVDDFFVKMLQWRKPDNVGIIPIQRIEIQPIQEDSQKKKKTDAVLSFIYTQIDTNPENITDFMNCLKKNQFISAETSITDFKHVFSGKQVESPIRWTTHLGGLLDLFRQLNNNKLINFDGNNMYKIVCTCFVDADGHSFDENKFKNGKIARSISDKIKKAVNLMK